MFVQPARERARRIELNGIKARHDARRTSRQFLVEYVTERMRGVCRHDEHAAAGACFRDGPGGRARRLADAAFAAVEDELWTGTRQKCFCLLPVSSSLLHTLQSPRR